MTMIDDDDGQQSVDPNLINLSFEDGTDGWQNATIGNEAYYAPVDGNSYAISKGNDNFTTKPTTIQLEAGETYRLTLWSRSIYSADHTQDLRNSTEDNILRPIGNAARAIANVTLSANDITLSEVAVDVSPPDLKGDAATVFNDDGANVFISDGFRVQMTGSIFYQAVASDPINDPWTFAGIVSPDYDGLAATPIITPQGLRGLLASFGIPGNGLTKNITPFTGTAPNFSFAINETEDNGILSHSGDENPLVLDGEPFYDEASQRLWMVWGGHNIWISELDPATGKLINNPPNLEFDTHVAGTHTKIMSFAGENNVGADPAALAADFEGDGFGTNYMEGAAVFHHNGFYYALGSYGNLGFNYTIRMGRSTDPTGPYLDKDGFDLAVYSSEINRYGASFLLGADGNQLVPGHPFVWKENGNEYFLGYDFRRNISNPDIEEDRMGIRRLNFVNDWPTIWTPIVITINADDFPDVIGQNLEIQFRNSGAAGSVAAFDLFDLSKQ